ncbi:hypothetical protein D3C75_1091290 [compost metagenome]
MDLVVDLITVEILVYWVGASLLASSKFFLKPVKRDCSSAGVIMAMVYSFSG